VQCNRRFRRSHYVSAEKKQTNISKELLMQLENVGQLAKNHSVASAAKESKFPMLRRTLLAAPSLGACLVLAAISLIAAVPDSAWIEEQKLTASDALPGEVFGGSVAISSNDVLIGAPNSSRLQACGGELGNQMCVVETEPGTAYIFRRSDGVWSEKQKLLAFDGEAGDRYGASVALHGGRSLISAPGDDIDSNPSTVFGECGGSACTGAGSVYVYRLQEIDGTYVFEAKLVASDGIRFNGRYVRFGADIDMDGSFAVIGAPGDDRNGINTEYGSAYVFERVGNNWYQRAKLSASDGQMFDGFGAAVAISGATVMVGAIQYETVTGNIAVGPRPGKVYVFQRQADGSWVEIAAITASGGAPGDRFGARIALSGNTVVIGATGHDQNGANSGTVYVFQSVGGTWTEIAQLVPNDNGLGDEFGSSLALDGDRIVVGARRTDEVIIDSGSAYVFRRDATGSWIEDAKIVGSDTTKNDFFGESVDISGDKIIIGVGGDMPTGYGDSFGVGAAYIFGVSADQDADGILDLQDNCPMDSNPDQIDNDSDGIGDVCDADDDNDTIADNQDNCPLVGNIGQSDFDGDGLGDACDGDMDGDGIANDNDNCPLAANADQIDTDLDGLGNACDGDDDGDSLADAEDNCPSMPNANQNDLDGDGIGDACDSDLDGDGVLNDLDNCPMTANSSQFDLDGDRIGDSCDTDVDGDNVINSSDLCAGTPSGERVDPENGCSIAQLSPCAGPRGTTSSWRNHGQYVSSVAKVVNAFLKKGLISESGRAAIVAAAAQSSCGM
jgi:hypothetical protein